MKNIASCLLLGLLAGSAGCSMHRNAHIAPAADVEMDASVLAKFEDEIGEYIELHQDLVHRIPNVGPNATAEEIALRGGRSLAGARPPRRRAGSQGAQQGRGQVRGHRRHGYGQPSAAGSGPADGPLRSFLTFTRLLLVRQPTVGADEV